MADNTAIIDRDTYRSIKKMSREELQGFLMRYAENLTNDSPVIDLPKLEQDIKYKGYRGETSRRNYGSD